MKKVIIVGATSGIGRELAKLLTKSGCIVGITGTYSGLSPFSDSGDTRSLVVRF